MSIKLIGIVLIVIGAAMIAYTGFNYISNDTVMKLGEITIDKQTRHPVRWSPFVGGAILGGGILIVLFTKKQIV